MVKRPGETRPDLDGGAAAARLRQFEAARAPRPAVKDEPKPKRRSPAKAPAGGGKASDANPEGTE